MIKFVFLFFFQKKRNLLGSLLWNNLTTCKAHLFWTFLNLNISEKNFLKFIFNVSTVSFNYDHFTSYSQVYKNIDIFHLFEQAKEFSGKLKITQRWKNVNTQDSLTVRLILLLSTTTWIVWWDTELNTNLCSDTFRFEECKLLK